MMSQRGSADWIPARYRHTGRHLAAVSAVAAIVVASPSFANTITFDSASYTGAGFAGSVTENGFTYSTLSGALVVNLYGNPGHDMEGLSVGGGGVLKVVSASGGDFTFNGLDFSAYNQSGSGSQTLQVEGFLNGSLVGTGQYTLSNTSVYSPMYPTWTTEAASILAGVTISELDIPLNAGIVGGNAFHQNIDNIVLTPVAAPAPAIGVLPAPASFALLAAGLLGLGLGHRRKAQKADTRASTCLAR
jgi:hypothetical protein